MKLAARAAGFLLAAGIALYPFTISPPETGLVLLAIAAGAALAGSVLTGAWFLFAFGMAMFAGEYSLALSLGTARLDLLAPAVAIGCLLLAEMIDLLPLLDRRADRGVVRARLRNSARLVAGAGFVGGAALLAGAASSGGHPIALIAAAACALGALGVAAAMVRAAVPPDF